MNKSMVWTNYDQTGEKKKKNGLDQSCNYPCNFIPIFYNTN